jgi:hypothetical protein
MIADGDSVARKAFRVALREDTPVPIPLTNLSVRATDAGSTQELDPADILEVKDVAEAIARAQRIVRAPRSRPRDLFESLGEAATDDTAGPASPAPPPSTFPPALAPAPESSTHPSQVSPPRQAGQASPDARLPLAAMRPSSPPPPFEPRPGILSIPGLARAPSSSSGGTSAPEDDAYYHPAGRIRGLADVTLDGYRPEPTLLLRARSRRQSFSFILIAALLPLIVLAAFTIFGQTEVASATTTTSAVSTVTTAAATASVAPRVVITSPTILTVGPMAKAPAATKPAGTARVASDGVPVFDVNSLPTARAKR